MSNKTDEIKVSVICTCFNHEKYIKDALESFVNQKTSFKYEVIVHDDASTDKSQDIIREYEKKYPDIIKPVYQTENQFSKGVKYVIEYMLPKASGKYFAFCEGDDYWTDSEKLQKQVDFLELHPEFGACVHNTEFEYMSDGNVEVKFPLYDREITLEDVFCEDKKYHTSSLMVKRELYIERAPWVLLIRGVGDLPSAIFYTASSRVMYLGEVMSHYRYCVPGSWTAKNKNSVKKQITNRKNLIAMLTAANNFYNNKYEKVLKKQILIHRFGIVKGYIKMILHTFKLKKDKE